ncbi:Unknown protein, partial [Striga hermonthica]
IFRIYVFFPTATKLKQISLNFPSNRTAKKAETLGARKGQGSRPIFQFRRTFRELPASVLARCLATLALCAHSLFQDMRLASSPHHPLACVIRATCGVLELPSHFCIKQARVYAVDQAEADLHPGTMSGMIIINDVPVFAFIDTGTTHSFISRRCLDAIGVCSVSAVDPLEVSLASGRNIVTDAKSESLSLSIGGRFLTTDAYVIEMRDFDLILDLDWLTHFHADIRCHDREITLFLSGDDQITYFGSRTRTLSHIISRAIAKKILRRGDCQRYLVSLVGDEPKPRTPHDIPIVREFVDVFPDQLPGGPPSRQ